MPEKRLNKPRRLTDRQARFVRAFAGGASATQAARDAGYSPAYADREAARLVEKPQVAAAIAELTAALARPTIATIKQRQEFWTSTMLDEKRRMIDRLKASELLGKSQGDFIERHHHSGPDGGPIAIVAPITDAERLAGLQRLAARVGASGLGSA